MVSDLHVVNKEASFSLVSAKFWTELSDTSSENLFTLFPLHSDGGSGGGRERAIERESEREGERERQSESSSERKRAREQESERASERERERRRDRASAREQESEREGEKGGGEREVLDGDARVAKLDRDRVRVVIPPIQLLLDSNISYSAAI